MKLVLLAEAQRRFEAEDEWWRENRDAKNLSIDEFARTLERLISTPETGLKKTSCHAYYSTIASTTWSKSTRSGVLVENADRSCSGSGRNHAWWNHRST